MLLFHEVCHSSKIYLLIEVLKLENGILKEVESNESDAFACLILYALVCEKELSHKTEIPIWCA